ncbi:hypothetical protein, partial [Microbispora triticiradicis]|uniref:hypothetical protein n=1 Tax=Microbispora triticiradicis TaxID=2200763 RepID=UPI001AD7CE21
ETLHLLPDPVTVPPPPGGGRVDLAALERDLREAVDGEVRFDATMRGAYSTDASNYRQVPLRGDRPAGRQGRAKHRRDGGAPLRRHPDVGG